MSKILIIALGGAVGAVVRYWLGGFVSSRWPMAFPLGTFVINVTGSFVIGVFMAFASRRPELDPHWRLLVVTGFLGAYTTFSSFEYETLLLIEAGKLVNAFAYVTLSLVIGFAAVLMGSALVRNW
ncbi:MAG TPA: fluoride efflux transporter CrcB [Blastocatellia bacterium]|nr:fluoride efflux transporter CrcB [Blastocatellia bacterium]